MRIDVIDFYFFSGTGNTLLVVREMSKVFIEKGLKVNLYRLEKTNPSDINLDYTIGIAFPVAVQGTFPFIWRFIKSLPETDKNTPLFIVDTLASFSGGIKGNIKRIISKKGYKPIGIKEITMPSNLLPKKLNIEKNNRKTERGLRKARRYAVDLLEEKTRWYSNPLSILLSIISQSEKPWRLFRQLYRFTIDEEKCIKCGLCVKLCPMENISMLSYPVFDDKCTFCMRCISFCPTEAIYIPNRRLERYHAVKAGNY
ncbi:MAG: 4Fe-4S ferredoxin [Thermoplasmata archaeon]|nr:MAG: 4Fe-4S ferredoxin [Thermoplasmata archaeon]